MKKVMIFFILSIFLLSFIVAEQKEIGDSKQNTCVQLKQVCDNCTYVNLTAVSNQNGYLLNGEYTMAKVGNNYNYSFCNTTTLGRYDYTTCGDLDGEITCQSVNFNITPSGRSGTENIVFMIFIIIIFYTVTFFGFFGKNIPITIIGGMGMIFLSVYLINSGVIIYRDTITIYFSYLTLGIGATMAIWAALEQLEII